MPSPDPSSAASSHTTRRPLRIALVSDFFHPRLGGVELHQYSIAQALIQRGHTVIVITGTYAPPSCSASSPSSSSSPRQGVRWLTGGLKVYYAPHMSFHQQASIHTLYAFLPLLRAILLRNRVDVVHCHQATSMLCHEAVLHAATLGVRAVYTDHSLFGFSSLSALHLNKLLSFTLSQAAHCIAVSHCSKENLVLRAQLDPSAVSVIPNAVDTTHFAPLPRAAPGSSSSSPSASSSSSASSGERVRVLVLSRLVYRKGIDLIVDVIPLVCARLSYVDFVIGGDGPKRLALDEMVERHNLHHRVAFLGPLPHTAVAASLTSAHLFLNTSLTEAFCIAILEAVSCGLYVVATRVGGVPEILPDDLIRFVDVDVGDVVEGVVEGVERVRRERGAEGGDEAVRWARHERVREMYNWHAVAERVERVYQRVMDEEPLGVVERLRRCREAGGMWASWLWCLAVLLDCLLLQVLEWWRPREEMEEGVDFPRELYERELDKEWSQSYQQQPQQSDAR